MLKIPHSSAALPWPRPFLTAMLATEGMPTRVGGEVRLPGYNRATAPTSSWDAAGHPASLVAGGLFVPPSRANATQQPCGRNYRDRHDRMSAKHRPRPPSPPALPPPLAR